MKSYQYPAAVRDYSKAKGPAKLVMYALATRVDDNGICFPSYATLMADAGLSLSGLRKAIKAIPVDELQVVQKGRAAGYPTTYRITVNCAPTEHSTVLRQVTNCVPTEHLTTNQLSKELPKTRNYASGSSSSAATSAEGTETADPPIPLTLQTPAFSKAWSDFDHYRRNGKRKKEWTARAKELALDLCIKLGETSAIAAINHSILNGYAGIFEPNKADQKPSWDRPRGKFGLPRL